MTKAYTMDCAVTKSNILKHIERLSNCLDLIAKRDELNTRKDSLINDLEYFADSKLVTRRLVLEYDQVQADIDKLSAEIAPLVRLINCYTDRAINRDKRFFSKVSSYDLTSEQVAILLTGGIK